MKYEISGYYENIDAVQVIPSSNVWHPNPLYTVNSWIYCLVYCLHCLFTLPTRSSGCLAIWQYVLCHCWRLSLARCLREKKKHTHTHAKKNKTYLLIYCTRRINCFLIPLSGLLIFLVMSISSMWHVAPWGNRARRSVPTARQTKCVCLCSWASLLCVRRR